MTCAIHDCGLTIKAKGFCSKHYQRLRAYGDPLFTKTAPNGEALKYFQTVVLTYEGNECLSWPYASRGGYGTLLLDGRMRDVHRRVCEEVNGAPPTPKHEAAHSCGNGKSGCVTKGHLSWKTRAENMDDRILHGTSGRGEKHNMAKLTETQVREIRALRGLDTQRAIAKRYSVSFQTVSEVQTGKKWGWLSFGEMSQ